jgi:hypothetical protein
LVKAWPSHSQVDFAVSALKITKTAPNTVHLGAIVSHTISLATLVHIVVIVGGDSREMGRFLTGLPSCERGLWAEQG